MLGSIAGFFVRVVLLSVVAEHSCWMVAAVGSSGARSGQEVAAPRTGYTKMKNGEPFAFAGSFLPSFWPPKEHIVNHEPSAQKW